jgi:four helix bundle protein
MTEQEFKDRTKQVALRIVRVVEALPSTRTADVIGKQLLRSGTSVGANYRAACRGRSPADVIAKLGIVEEEADESIYWLELLIESGTLPANRLTDLIDELNQILAMVVASQKTLRARIQTPRSETKNLK